MYIVINPNYGQIHQMTELAMYQITDEFLVVKKDVK